MRMRRKYNGDNNFLKRIFLSKTVIMTDDSDIVHVLGYQIEEPKTSQILPVLPQDMVNTGNICRAFCPVNLRHECMASILPISEISAIK